ncbi:MAG: metallophosphoesterase [Clostridia bacterium]|nr:metallophosphoesterase [Clostridia bacterium]
MKKTVKSVIAICLCWVLALSIIPVSAFAKSKNAKLSIGIISDPHVYPQSYMGDDISKFVTDYRADTKQFEYSEQLLDVALNTLAAHAKKNGMKYVILPGDITKDSEICAHEVVAERLEKFEKDTGITVLVINGNHDVNNSDAVDYRSGDPVKDGSQVTTPEKYLEIYKNLGYDVAYHTFTPPEGAQQGMMTYSVKLDGNYRFIAFDSNCFSSDCTKKGRNEHDTRGMVSDALMEWLIAECKDAVKHGETIIGMCHHNIVAHHDLENNVLNEFAIDDWQNVATQLANAGMHFVFTGHQHSNDVASYVTEEGETIFDCETDSLSSFPHDFKEVIFDNTDPSGKIVCDYSTYRADVMYKLKDLEGNTINDFAKFSFQKVFMDGGNGDVGPYFDAIIDKYAMDTIISIGGKIGLTEEQSFNVARDLVTNLKTLKVSDTPSTKFKKEIGFGDDEYGTLDSAICSAWYYLSCGDEYIEDDEFLKDAIEQCRHGDVGARVVFTLLETILDNSAGNADVLKFVEGIYTSALSMYSGLAGNLPFAAKFAPAKAPDDASDDTVTDGDDSAVTTGATGETEESSGGLDLSILKKIPGMNVDTLKGLLSNPSLVGQLLGYALESMCIDENPGEKQDNNYAHIYSGKVEPANNEEENPTEQANNEPTTTPSNNNGGSAVPASNIPGGNNPGTGGAISNTTIELEPRIPSVELVITLGASAIALCITAILRKKREEA